ncbi:hypothetical protein [Microbacterium sp.]|uniref:SCO4402 family protein n=1 Tax=Microbacterium sp. TaxID=51671 RepID=UPI00333E5276
MSVPVEFPYMREEVFRAIRGLSDRGYQDRVWGRHKPGSHFFSDLNLNIHILFDDMRVFPDPEPEVGAFIYADEVAAFREVGPFYDALIDALGDQSQEVYLRDPRWGNIVQRAKSTMWSMLGNEAARREVDLGEESRVEYELFSFDGVPVEEGQRCRIVGTQRFDTGLEGLEVSFSPTLSVDAPEGASHFESAFLVFAEGEKPVEAHIPGRRFGFFVAPRDAESAPTDVLRASEVRPLGWGELRPLTNVGA